jgi:glutaredoxin-like protein
MSAIKDSEKESLKKEFSQKLVEDVTLIVFTQDVPCIFCSETVQLAQELGELSPKIHVETYDFIRDQRRASELRIDKIPAIAVVSRKDYGVRFFGMPSGFEFGSLTSAVIDVSRGESGLSQKTKDTLKSLDQPVHLQVFITPTCPHCAPVVRLAHKMAIESDMVWADMIEANEFIPLAQKYHLTGVPKTIINDKSEVQGAVPENVLLSHVMHAVEYIGTVQPR